MSSKTKKFRSRTTTASSSEEDEDVEARRPAAAVPKNKPKKKEAAAAPSSAPLPSSKKTAAALLSFDDDEDEGDDGGILQALKSKNKKNKALSSSKKSLRKALEQHFDERAAEAGTGAAGGGSSGGGGGEYSKEKLAELKKGQHFQVSTKAARETERNTRVTFELPEGVGEEGGEYEDEDEGERGGAMDRAEIDRLKKEKRRREALRAGHVPGEEDEEGFIPLDGSRRPMPIEGKNSKGGKGAAALAAAAEPVDQAIDDDWESEMIRRGAPKSKGGGGGGEENGGYLSSSLSSPHFKTVAAVLTDLKSTKARVEDAHSRNERSCEQARSELQGINEGLGKMQAEFEETAKRFQFFQDVREYLSSLCGCLREKEGMIKELEEAMAQVRKEGRDRRVARRAEDQEDSLEEVLEKEREGGREGQLVLSLQGYVPTVVKTLAGGGGGGGEKGGGGQLDEFGRDVSGDMDRARRRKHRRKRQELVLQKLNSSSSSISISNSTTDTTEAEATFSGAEEDEKDVQLSHSRQAKLLEAATVIFEDAADEFRSLDPVASRFEEWKKKYPKDYATAYVPIALSQVFEPYVRVEMVRWNPLEGGRERGGEEGGKALEGFAWFERLFEYGQGEGDGRGEKGGEGEDADERLVPVLVEKVAVTKLQQILEECYDPVSGKETQRAVAAVQGLLIYEPGKHALELLLQAPLRKIEEAIMQVCLPLFKMGEIFEGNEGGGEGMRYQRRQLFVAVKLFRNACAWHEVLAPRALAPIVLGKLLEGKISPALENRMDNTSDSPSSLSSSSLSHSLSPSSTMVEILGTLEALLAATPPALLLERGMGPLVGVHRLLDKLETRVRGGPLASTVKRMRVAFLGTGGGVEGK